MTKEKVDNQQVDEQTGFREGDVNPSCEGESCANVADDEQIATDTMAEGEEPSSEQQEFQEPSSSLSHRCRKLPTSQLLTSYTETLQFSSS